MWTDAHNHCSSVTCRPIKCLTGKGVLSRKQPAWQGWRFTYYLSAAYKVGKRAEIAQSVQSSSDALDNRGLVAVKYFFSSPKRSEGLWGSTSLMFKRHRGLFAQRNSGRDAKLTVHLHLLPRVKNEGVMPLPHVPSWNAHKLLCLYPTSR